MFYTGGMQTIGVRDLQQQASRVIRDVESGAQEYLVTVQGRATDVVIVRREPRHAGGTVEQALASALADRQHDQVTAELISGLEAGRDGAGVLGDRAARPGPADA